MENIKRRNFLLQSSVLLAALGLSSKTWSQSRPIDGEIQPKDEAAPVCPAPPKLPEITSEISRNHGHVLVLSYEEVIIGEAKDYSIQGRSGHPHTLRLLPEHFEALRKVQAIDVESDQVAGHTHMIRIIRSPIQG